MSLRKSRENITGDQRILGTGDFVQRILSESDGRLRYRHTPAERRKRVETILKEECRKGKIALKELQMGSRRGRVPQVRSAIAQELVRKLGMPLAEAARLLGVSTSGISRIMERSIE